MTDLPPRRSVLLALSHEPDFSGVCSLPPLSAKHGSRFVQWLDRSGLALTFWQQLEKHNATNLVSESWRKTLRQRLAKNIARTKDMLAEAERVNAAFYSFGVIAPSLKGFTLSPDFCDDPCLRQQVDLDFLVSSANLPAAAEALRTCGYFTNSVNESGETTFYTPLRHIPSLGDDLYALPRHRQIDLHTNIWESYPWLSIDVPTDCLEFIQPHTFGGAHLLSLSTEDKFLVQVLHAFRHALRSWVRVSWLLEISSCLECHYSDASLWNRVVSRAGGSALTKSVFTFVLGLVARLFQTPIPLSLRAWTADAATPSLRAWLDHFSVDWALADWPGSLSNLFLATEFISDSALRRQYWRSRLIPRIAQASVGSFVPINAGEFIRLQASRFNYLSHRATVHLKDIAFLPRQHLRWKRTLLSYRGASFDSIC